MMKLLLLTLSLSFSPQFVFAKWIKYKPLIKAVEAGDQLYIRGYKGKVLLSLNEGSKDLKISVRQSDLKTNTETADGWNISVKRDGSIIKAVVEGPPSKQEWSKIIQSGGVPEIVLEVQGPSMPANINWKEGAVIVKNWKSPVKINHIEGKVAVDSMVGDLDLQSQKGKVTINNHEGLLNIKSYSAEMTVKDLKGNIIAENYSGSSRIQNVEGNITFSSFKGGSKITDLKGEVDFKNGRSEISFSDIEGSIRGSSGQGPIIAHLKGKVDMRVRTKEGPVSLKVPGSGAWANLGTEEGTLYVPLFLKLTRLPSLKVRQGRLRGSNTGKIFVRTESGDIRLR